MRVSRETLLAAVLAGCGVTSPGQEVHPLPDHFVAAVDAANDCLVAKGHMAPADRQPAQAVLWLDADDLGRYPDGTPVEGEYHRNTIRLLHGARASRTVVRHEWIHHAVAPHDDAHRHPAFRQSGGPELACDGAPIFTDERGSP